MPETDTVVFDEKSGISVEEQKEILSKINGIAEKNRRSLSQGLPAEKGGGKRNAKLVINAKKTGAFFPLAVNAAAIIALCAGAFLLVFFNGRADAQVRKGTAVLNLTERALIEEIRKETAEKINAKEREIASIAMRLEEVDSQIALLYSGNQVLSSEQLAAQERLLSMQNSYRSELAVLHEERSQILESSRSREARLRAQLEERTKEFAAAQQRTSSELDSAVSEIERLAGEQEAVAAIDAHLAGGLAVVGGMVQNGEYDQAAQTVENLRLFNNGNSIASARSFQSRREFYNQAINSMDAMIAQLRKNSGADDGRESRDLQARTAQLEDTIAEMQKTIDGLNSGSSGQSRRLNELEASVSTLRAANASLQAAGADKDRNITSLNADKAALTQNVADRDNTIRDLRSDNASKDQEIVTLRNQLAVIREALLD